MTPMKKKLTDPNSAVWYERAIEKPLRELVHHLRDNGINTECSCAHDTPMYIQCFYAPDGEIREIHQLVWTFLSERKLPINFSIELSHDVRNGHSYSSVRILIPNSNSHLEYWKKMRKYHQERVDQLTHDIEKEETSSKSTRSSSRQSALR